MKQKSILSTFWFWLLIIGLLLILTALLIGGGMKKITGWVWVIFIIGAVLAVLGIIFAIYEWFSIQNCVEKVVEQSCSKNVAETNPISPVNYYERKVSSPMRQITPIRSPEISTMRTNEVPQIRKIETSQIPSSPIKTPSVVKSNVPQAQRGFATTSMDISSLSPN